MKMRIVNDLSQERKLRLTSIEKGGIETNSKIKV